MLSIKHLQRLQVHSKCHIKFLQAVQPFSLTFIHDFLFLCHPHPFLSLVFRAISLYDAITSSSTSNKCSSSISVELKISLGFVVVLVGPSPRQVVRIPVCFLLFSHNILKVQRTVVELRWRKASMETRRECERNSRLLETKTWRKGFWGKKIRFGERDRDR